MHSRSTALRPQPCVTHVACSIAVPMQVPPYELTEVGWGEFDIIVTVHFRVRKNRRAVAEAAVATS